MADPTPTPVDVVCAVNRLKDDARDARKSAVHDLSILVWRQKELEDIGIKVKSDDMKAIRKALGHLEPDRLWSY